MVYSDILLNYALLVCTWRHGGHIGGQEQKHLYPLGTKRHFHVNSSRKNSSVLTTNMAALSRGCKQNIFHYEVRSYATPQGLFFVHQHGRRDVTWKRSLEARPSVPVWCILSLLRVIFKMFLLVETWKARLKTSFSDFEYLGLHLKTLHSPSSKVLSKKVTASSTSRIAVLPVPRGRGMRQGRKHPSSFLEVVFVSPIKGRWGWNVNWLKKLE